MIGDQAKCENPGCDVVFIKKTHNQKYHDNKCCMLATNKKQKEKYHDGRARKLGLARECIECDRALSRYNSDSICNACALSNAVNKSQSVINMLSLVVA